MTGPELWQIFVSSGVPTQQLKALGYDLYFARKAPTGDGIPAVNALAAKLGISPVYAYAAMNIDPGRKTLEEMAQDYERRRGWANLTDLASAYLTRVAQRINIIKNKSAPSTVPSAAPATSIPSSVRATAMKKVALDSTTTTNKPLWPFVVGASAIVGLMSYFSHKGQAIIHARVARQHGLRHA